MKTMPTHIAVMLEGHNDLIMVITGQSGWIPMTNGSRSLKEADEWVEKTYKQRPPQPEERKAALHGAIFGWDSRGADPGHWAKEPVA